MALIEWTDELTIGIPTLDGQHQQLVALINDLQVAMLERREKAVLSRIFGELVETTTTHFATEETLFAEHGYPGEAEHAHEHQHLAERVIGLKEDFDAGNTAVTLEVMRFLREWLLKHILESDQAFAPFLRGRGVS